jgi:uncharacterized protein YjbI with pentapeptide repeats
MADGWRLPEQLKPEALIQSGSIDARGACWRNADLSKLNLKNAKLCRVDLRGSDLSQNDLEGADLRLARYDQSTSWPVGYRYQTTGAIGPGAKLNGQFLNGADLRGMDLREASFLGAYLSGADLSGSLLDGVSFVGADLRNASFKGARCKKARFNTSQLNMTDFRGADLEQAELQNADSIEGADFSYCKHLGNTIISFLERSTKELDVWNPITRQQTRKSLECLMEVSGS